MKENIKTALRTLISNLGSINEDENKFFFNTKQEKKEIVSVKGNKTNFLITVGIEVFDNVDGAADYIEKIII